MTEEARYRFVGEPPRGFFLGMTIAQLSAIAAAGGLVVALVNTVGAVAIVAAFPIGAVTLFVAFWRTRGLDAAGVGAVHGGVRRGPGGGASGVSDCPVRGTCWRSGPARSARSRLRLRSRFLPSSPTSRFCRPGCRGWRR